MRTIDLARDVLDSLVVDRVGTKLGRVDGLVLDVPANGPPTVSSVEMGFVVLARRVGPRAERFVERLRRWSVRKTARYRVPWTKVLEITENHVQLDVEALKTPAFDWEVWLRDHFVAHVPGED